MNIFEDDFSLTQEINSELYTRLFNDELMKELEKSFKLFIGNEELISNYLNNRDFIRSSDNMKIVNQIYNSVIPISNISFPNFPNNSEVYKKIFKGLGSIKFKDCKFYADEIELENKNAFLKIVRFTINIILKTLDY